MDQSTSQVKLNTINNSISSIIIDIINKLNVSHIKKEALYSALKHLADIKTNYQLTDDLLYQQTLKSLSSVIDIYPFEAEILIQQLINRYFNQRYLFNEAYEISVLKLTKPEYQHLIVEEPFIKLTVPTPYESQPLSEAKYMGDAQCLYFDDDELESPSVLTE